MALRAVSNGTGRVREGVRGGGGASSSPYGPELVANSDMSGGTTGYSSAESSVFTASGGVLTAAIASGHTSDTIEVGELTGTPGATYMFSVSLRRGAVSPLAAWQFHVMDPGAGYADLATSGPAFTNTAFETHSLTFTLGPSGRMYPQVYGPGTVGQTLDCNLYSVRQVF